MQPRHRDGLLAVLGLVVLAALTLATAGPAALLAPVAVLAGAAGALALELVFLRYPDRALGLWERRGVPGVALVGLLAGAVLAVRAAPWLAGAAVWGLLTYLGLLACVLAGVGNPLAALAK
ncbi:hypothetical protein [Halorientalis marina]|uniref:hypothetical protein n=1 Tax=Halorientalis marina TaxID=2931976 RepID=UPI001FF61D77|nr:hypothetical protein [Halorientalis marina]